MGTHRYHLPVGHRIIDSFPFIKYQRIEFWWARNGLVEKGKPDQTGKRKTINRHCIQNLYAPIILYIILLFYFSDTYLIRFRQVLPINDTVVTRI
jgi:hypothetical protein